MNKPSFKNISRPITETEYREDKALSYSILSRYERCGFNELNSLFDRIETPSLTFGSAVDSIITGGRKEFDERFMVAEFPEVPDSIQPIVDELFALYSDTSKDLYEIADKNIIEAAARRNYQRNWKPETRVRVIRDSANEYYRLLYVSGDRTILSTKVYNDVLATVNALKEGEATKWYFQEDNPFENIERLYQLKFRATINGVDYKCMADLIIVDHDAKTVQPVDLKTSSKKEWDFYKSFIDWRYDIQARLYWRIIRDCMDKDPYFKDFKLMPYQFIVANKSTLVPLVWGFLETEKQGTLYVGKDEQFELRDPCKIGEELSYYLNNMPKVPTGINVTGVNDLSFWLEKL